MIPCCSDSLRTAATSGTLVRYGSAPSSQERLDLTTARREKRERCWNIWRQSWPRNWPQTSGYVLVHLGMTNRAGASKPAEILTFWDTRNETGKLPEMTTTAPGEAAGLDQSPTNLFLVFTAPSIVPIVQLSSAEAAHMSDPRAETAEPSCTVKSRPTGEPGEAMEATGAKSEAGEPGEVMEATGAKSEAGEPAEGIAVAIIRPVIVTRPTLGIVAAARPDTAVPRGERVSGRADQNRSGGVRRRSAQHRRGRERGCRARWVRSRY